MTKIINNILSDLRVELLDEFDKNFQRKSFFGRSWPKGRMPNKRGSMMMRSGALRKGNQAQVVGSSIRFTNSQPYAALHNEGGTIAVTPQMKKFFWAMYYKFSGAASGSGGKQQRSLNEEAEMWKRLALKKVGSQITIEQRQFIGFHPELRTHIERVFNHHLKDIDMYIKNKLKR